MNQTIYLGRLTKDIEIRKSTKDKVLAIFDLAVKRDFKNKEGVHETDFIPCIAWGKLATLMQDHLNKGSRIQVIGRTTTFKKEISQKFITSQICVAEKIEFLDSKKEVDFNNIEINWEEIEKEFDLEPPIKNE